MPKIFNDAGGTACADDFLPLWCPTFDDVPFANSRIVSLSVVNVGHRLMLAPVTSDGDFDQMGILTCQ